MIHLGSYPQDCASPRRSNAVSCAGGSTVDPDAVRRKCDMQSDPRSLESFDAIGNAVGCIAHDIGDAVVDAATHHAVGRIPFGQVEQTKERPARHVIAGQPTPVEAYHHSILRGIVRFMTDKEGNSGL